MSNFTLFTLARLHTTAAVAAACGEIASGLASRSWLARLHRLRLLWGPGSMQLHIPFADLKTGRPGPFLCLRGYQVEGM